MKDAELKLAIMLTDQIATDEFHPENYKDEVKERVEGLDPAEDRRARRSRETERPRRRRRRSST